MMKFHIMPMLSIRKCRHCGHQITAPDEAHDTCRACGINLDVLYPIEVT